MEVPEIIILDEDMVPVSRINSYQDFQWDHLWYEDDTFEVNINRYMQNVDTFIEGGFITYLSPIEGRCVGTVESIEKPLTSEGKRSEIWSVKGRGIESIFGSRQMRQNWAVGDGFLNLNSDAETDMRNAIDAEVISCDDVNRRLSGISLEHTNQHRGISISYQARMPKYLNEVLQDLCMQSGLSYRLVWTETGRNFVFTVRAGADHSVNPGRVVLSVDFGNVSGYDYLYSIFDYRNFVYIGGPGDAATRTLESVPVSSIPTGWNRKEVFVDATSSTTVNERTAIGNQNLKEREAAQTLDFTFDQSSQTFVIGTDFNLGDMVVIDIPPATKIDRITRISERYDTLIGRSYEIGVGTAAPDLISIIARNTKQIAGLTVR